VAALLAVLVLAGATGNLALAEEVEVIEELDDVEELAGATPGTVEKRASLEFGEMVGRFHPALVHVPIAWLLLLFIVDAGALVFRRRGWERAGLLLHIGTLISFVPAMLTGLIRASHVVLDESQLTTLNLHRNLNIAVVALVVVALAVRLKRRNHLGGVVKLAYLVLVLTSVALVSVAGHIGGKMVFGENYLPF
jgi:uncharacterized membrane protein